MKTISKKNITINAALCISALCYFVLAYYTKRENPLFLFGTLGVLFAFYFYISKLTFSERSFNLLLLSAIVFRLLFIFAIPALSDDYFRFIWDGRLIDSGINPFVYLPDHIQANSFLTGEANTELFNKMNSPHYYSVYPPILQVVFFIAAKLSFNNNFVAVIILRIFILLAEFGTYFFLRRILVHLKLPKTKVLLYLLNPLVIIELSGNLHFEGVMLFFVAAALYYFVTNNLIYSSILFAFAVCTKMIPLVILPLIVRKLGLKNGFIYSLIILILSVILFLPFLNQQLISNIGSSVGLYFQKFEFNASIYYLFRWVGFHLTGYNAIGIIGKLLPMLSLIFILIITLRFKSKNSDVLFFDKVLQILLVYYLFSLIIHPWYISFLVLISVFSNFRFALIWSLLIFGSYLTYVTLPYKENMWIVVLEYSVVLVWFLIEQRKLKIYSNL